MSALRMFLLCATVVVVVAAAVVVGHTQACHEKQINLFSAFLFRIVPRAPTLKTLVIGSLDPAVVI